MTAQHKPTVVVVEDDENIGYLLNFMLTREGYQVLVVADGREASDLIGSIQSPDLVLLDVMLPFLAAIAENFGYRQLNSVWRLMVPWYWARGEEGHWGNMTRKASWQRS